MSFFKIVTLTCDEAGCEVRRQIKEPHVDSARVSAAEFGWRTVTLLHGIGDVCPVHARRRGLIKTPRLPEEMARSYRQ